MKSFAICLTVWSNETGSQMAERVTASPQSEAYDKGHADYINGRPCAYEKLRGEAQAYLTGWRAAEDLRFSMLLLAQDDDLHDLWAAVRAEFHRRTGRVLQPKQNLTTQ